MPLPSCLLLFLLCLSLHACNARRLVVADHKKIEKKFQISNQSDHQQKEMLVAHKMEHSSTSNEVEAKGGSKDDTLILENKSQMVKELSAKKKLTTMEDEKEESRVSGSSKWHVPKKKSGEKHPGFNLDYSPPKTHPPSHN